MGLIEREIEQFFNTNSWQNTNHKEQNLQGRLYSFLLHLEEDGYTIEMESNIAKDKHLSWLFSNHMKRDVFCKSEIDILIFREKTKEAYAIELKWFYDPTFHYFDRYSEYCEDVLFAYQLKEYASFIETAALTIVEEEQLSKPRSSRRNYYECLYPFSFNHPGGSFITILDKEAPPPTPIEWKDCSKYLHTSSSSKYYLVVF